MAITEFELTHNKLYRRPDNRYLVLRYIAPGSEAFDIIAIEYLQLLHAGRKKV
jgi:hypothetical protein